VQTGSLSIYSGSSELIAATTNGSHDRVIVATASSISFGARNFSAGTTATIDNISVREILSADVWQDSAGTIPATIGSTVGLLTDRSFGGELGGELVANGDFSAALGAPWFRTDVAQPWSVADGELVLTSAGIGGAYQTIPTVAGRSYEVIGNIRRGTTTDVRLRAATPSWASTILAESAVITATTPVGVRLVFTATGATTDLYLRNNGAGTGYFDNISVRELRGNHATQSTAGNRPVMATHNGKPILSFNGTSNSMQLATNPIGPNLSQPYTIIVGGVVGALGTARRVCGDLARWVSITAVGGVAITNAGALAQLGDVLSAGQPFVIEVTWNGTTAIVRLNGVVIISSALAAPTGVTPGAFFVGQNGANTLFHAGLLLPVFATGSVVPEAQRRAIARGMAQKLGVTYV
jgi:hypothetical protein